MHIKTSQRLYGLLAQGRKSVSKRIGKKKTILERVDGSRVAIPTIRRDFITARDKQGDIFPRDLCARAVYTSDSRACSFSQMESR